jgi:hypothetical protein
VKFSVYGIVDPRDNLVFYVGHTSRFDLRCAQHREGGESLSGLTIQQIQKSGREPVFLKLERCASREAAQMAEIFWIELFKARGARLMNAQGFAGYVARADKRERLKEGLAELSGVTAVECAQLEGVAKGRPARWGRPWSRNDEVLLHKLAREGKSAAEIADRLNRTIGGVETRLSGKAPNVGSAGNARRGRKNPTIH